MKCEAINLGKYLDKSPNIFFIFGSEVTLKNHVKSRVLKTLSLRGFMEKITLSDENFKEVKSTIAANAGGSLFGSKLIIELRHGAGKIPEAISEIFNDDLNQYENISIIINSHLDKLSLVSKWAKQMEANSLVIECKKLKSFEEQIWLKKNLSFIPDNYRSDVVKLLSEMNSGNLVAQQNEIELLKLLYLDSNQDKKDLSDITNHMINSAEFSPFELEDAILQGQTKKALEIVKSLRKADSYSGPLLIWIMGKITSLASLASRDNSPQIYLKDNGVWQSKINDYLSFMKNQTKQDLELMQKSIYDLELSLKGLIKKDFWIELESLICKLGPN